MTIPVSSMKEPLLTPAGLVVLSILTGLADGMVAFMPTAEMMVTMTLLTLAISNVSKSRGLTLMQQFSVLDTASLLGI